MARADPHEHVVILMLENQSFDRILGALPGVQGILRGSEARTNTDSASGRTVSQAPSTTFIGMRDPAHEHEDVVEQIAGGAMGGFFANFARHEPDASEAQLGEVMAYYEPGALPVLHELARHFAVCDMWFSSVPGPTWPNRFFVHSGSSDGQVEMPESLAEPNVHVYNQQTVYNLLHEAGVDWRIYFGDVPQALALTKLLPHANRFDHMSEFFQAAAGDAASFPQYAFIEPSYFVNQNDQHPPSDMHAGEALIARVYNALAANRRLFETTLLIVTYDEHGGYFDHVPPPPCVAPDGQTSAFSFAQLGVRVPTVLISPWLAPGVVSDVYDHTAVLRYACDRWHLNPASLGARTAAAAPLLGVGYARLLAAPRTDCPTAVAVPACSPHGDCPLNCNQSALLALAHRLDNVAEAVGSRVEDAMRRVDQFIARARQSVADAGKKSCCAAQ